MSAKVIRVIETKMGKRGNGRDDPLRTLTQYWSEEGEMLAEVDPYIESLDIQTVLKAARSLAEAAQEHCGTALAGYVEHMRKVLGDLPR